MKSIARRHPTTARPQPPAVSEPGDWLAGCRTAERDRTAIGPRPVIWCDTPPTAYPEYHDGQKRWWVVDDGRGVKPRAAALAMTPGGFFRTASGDIPEDEPGPL